MTFMVLLATICLLPQDFVAAQSRNEFGSDYRSRRTVTPWLSTLDNGNGNGALNYFNIVRPQKQARQTGQSLKNDLNRLETRLPPKDPQTTGSTSSVPITTGRMNSTGHPTSYATTGTYFGGGLGNGNRGNTQNRFGRNGKN
jgi:hypothetical protein